MILRTPPPSKKQRLATSPVGPDKPLVIYEDPSPSLPAVADSIGSQPLLCTYQCQQMVKADFIEALSNAEKQVVEYRSKFEDLNASFSQADSERKIIREQFMNIQQELAAAAARERSLQDQLLNDVNQSQERYKKQLAIQNKLEAKLENERVARENFEHEAVSAKSQISELEGKLRNILESQERDKKHMNSDLIQAQRESESCISKLKLDLEKVGFRANHAEEELKILNNKLDTIRVQLKECLNEKSELEKKLLSFSYQESSSSENSMLIKNLQNELRKYEFDVREARKLKKTHEEIEIIREKLLEEKSGRERAQAELARLQSAELNAKKLENELLSLKSIVNNIPGVSCADDIPLKFSALQKEIFDNMTKLGDANAMLKKLEVALDAAQTEKNNAENEVAISNGIIEALKQELKQMSLLLSSVTVERDAFMKVVEETRKTKSDSPENEMRNNNLIRELESALLKNESYIKEFESEMLQSRDVTHRQLLEIELLNDKISNEARKVKSLERENDRLLQQIALLESKLGHGDFSGESTKVLRMVNSPSLDVEAKQTIEALQTELQKAKEKLSAIEELKNHSGYDGKLVDSYISGKISQLKDQVATLEKREERYKTVFADRISVFRRACCELFGYKIVMDEHQRPNGIPVTRFTLKSIFADTDDDKLEFDYESGNITILANEYTSQSDISRQVEIFVRRMNSIPAFTANLTMESFNKRTLS